MFRKKLKCVKQHNKVVDMGKIKIYFGTFAALLFVLVILFTNDRIREHIPYVNYILTILFICLIILAVFTIFYFTKK